MDKNNIITVLVSIIASVTFSVALAGSSANKGASSGAFDKSEINTAIENYLNENPGKIREALEASARQEQEEAQKRAAEAYSNNWDDLISNSPAIGPKDAKVTVVEFFDFNCGYCKRLAPELTKVIKKNPDVRYVFKPVTFLGSIQTAKAALAAEKQGKFMEVYEEFLTHNGQVTPDVIDEIIKKAGLDVAKTKEIMESDEIKKSLADITELSNKVGIRGVPTLIINKKPLQAIEEAPIQAAIDEAK